MNKATTRLLTIVLALSVIMTGCSSKNNSSNNASNAPDSSPETTNSSLSSSEPGWKSNTSPVSLSWYTGVAGYSKKWDAKDNYADKLITEETGVSVDFIHAGNDVNSEFNVMMATGNLPDIISLDRWNSTSLIQTLMSSGTVAPLNELMEQYDPYLSTILPESMVDWYTQEDGNVYAIPNYYVSPEMLDEYPDVKPFYNDHSNGQIIVRKDIMDQLGITVEDLQQEDSLIAALKKVKEANIQYKGMTVLPLYFDDKDKYISDSLGVLAGSFGAVYEAEDGSYVDVRRTSEYKHVLEFGNKLFSEGLLSLENFTSARNQIEEKMTQGAIFMKIGSYADYTSPVTQLYVADPNAKYITIDAIKSNEGTLPQYGRSLNKGWTLTFVNKKSKHADRAIQFIEYLYSDHGQTVNNFGKEGETYTVTADGKYKRNPEIDEAFNTDWNAASKKWGFESIWWLANEVWLKHVKEVETTELTKYQENLFYGTSKYMFSNDTLDSGNLFDAYEPGSDEANSEAKITVYWAQIVPKMLLAKNDAEFESLYKEAITTMDKLGLPSIEAAKDKRVQDFKSATGIQLVSPKYTGEYK
ncbi:putative aldouronate transport system substrate-binding protein [Paenibacillus anaericanus]|uniref:Extracellular solute-binding protein n=1 Tax=Paenibacillus anaericanus TaxID=170367 RepID=A0A433Y1R7_9BACL|nr:extracellular solute-binding protein [Paenibacillus anaericanus]MDQ0091221.1 putative aldouronate transport system substrate-binding protein [Paenibacillus anaericanus]RUT41494.1 hypothetical protein EJP82_23400 [Paenibacillus anaericanus]